MRFHDVLADLRFALRMVRKNPAFSSVAILLPGAGNGATSAMSSLVYALWVDPYPYRDSNRLLNLSFVDQQGRNGTMGYSLADYLELQRSATTLEEVAARDGMAAVVTSGLPESVRVVLFTPNAFDHFGVPAMVGRTWIPRDFPQPGAPVPVAVLSYSFWAHHFNADPTIAGRTIELNRQAYTILGVVPPRFTWNDADVYLPYVRHTGLQTLRGADDPRQERRQPGCRQNPSSRPSPRDSPLAAQTTIPRLAFA